MILLCRDHSCELWGGKAKAQQTSQLNPGQLFISRRATLCGIQTNDTLYSRRALYQLSYQGTKLVGVQSSTQVEKLFLQNEGGYRDG